jgi:hypothetical protein
MGCGVPFRIGKNVRICVEKEINLAHDIVTIPFLNMVELAATDPLLSNVHAKIQPTVSQSDSIVAQDILLLCVCGSGACLLLLSLAWTIGLQQVNESLCYN